VARAAEARLFELRALSSLLGLRLREGLDPGPARTALEEVVSSFGEGAETPHVTEARRLLASA
jgi:predicted ATPase